ncbi:MAG: pyrroline-5-carboxylate reductase [Eubacterium sp.]
MAIGFIGCGNMGSAIINGVINSGVMTSDNIYVYDRYQPAMDAMVDKFGVNACNNEIDVVNNADAVILAVKPNIISSVLDSINAVLEQKSTLLISIAAGKTIDYIRSGLTHDNRIIRVMPNINAVVGEAMSAYTANNDATRQDKELVESVFGGVGKIIYLEEKEFPLFGVMGGCSPAFVYMFIDAMARAGVENGMKKDTALVVAAQAVLGSAKMIIESDRHPWELVDRVCSPGGTTIEGVISLQADGLESAVHNAINKSLEKDSKL